MSGADPLLAIARQLAREAELPDPVRLDRLPGGKNNRVFRVTLADGSDAVLKSYHVDARDNRDRLGAEWAFLKFAWARGVRTIPVPLAADHGCRAQAAGTFLPRPASYQAVMACVDWLCVEDAPLPQWRAARNASMPALSSVALSSPSPFLSSWLIAEVRPSEVLKPRALWISDELSCPSPFVSTAPRIFAARSLLLGAEASM